MMDTKEIKTLCLKQVYGAAFTDAERQLVDDYTQTTDGREYLRECREMKDLMEDVADVQVKPVDHEALVERFESTVRQKFDETIFQPWWRANIAPVILGLMAGVFIFLDDGWSVINTALLGVCVLWLIADYFQRHYFAKVLSRPDLYEFAKTSRKRSDRILQSLPGKALATVVSGLVIAAMLYATYWIHLEFGLVGSAIVIFVLVKTVVIVVYQYRKMKRADSEVWDWWEDEIKE